MSGRGEAVDEESERPAGQAQQQRAALAHRLDQPADHTGLDDDVGDAGGHQHQADIAGRPAIAEARVEHEDAGQDVVGQLEQEEDAGEAKQVRVRRQQLQRADGVGLLPVELGHAPLRRQGFRQDQQAVEPVGESQACGDQERQAQVDLAQEAADARPDDEPDAEGRAEQAEGGGALLRRGDVGDVGARGGEAGGGDPVQRPADEQPRKRRSEGHEQIVDAEAEDRDQQHRPTAEAVRQHAEDRREEELHDRPDGGEHHLPVGGQGRVAAIQGLHEVGQDRDHDPERDHVHQRRGVDEPDGGLALGAGDGNRRRLGGGRIGHGALGGPDIAGRPVRRTSGAGVSYSAVK